MNDRKTDTLVVEESNRLVAERVPLAAVIFAVVFGVAWIFEHRYHPERDVHYALVYAAEILTVIGGVLLVRWRGGRLRARLVAVATTIALLLWVALYNVTARGEAEVMALAFLYILTATMVVLPWGWQGQLPVTLAALVIYPVALVLGAIPWGGSPNSILGLLTMSVASVAGAAFMARYRTRLLRQTAELRAANDALQAANQAKDHFLASLSHELRTPLNIIVGYTDLLAEGNFGDLSEEAVRALRRVSLSSRMLTYLINDLLDLARIESGHLSVNLRRVPLSTVFQTMNDLMSPRVAPSTVRLRIEDPGPLSVLADRDRLEQILVNLLSNAIKFTERGEIRMQARREGESAIAVEVRDTGPGIADDEMPQLFERFVQGKAGRGRGGVGVGLSVSLSLAKAMGGSLTVNSCLGEGSTFTVRLPASL